MYCIKAQIIAKRQQIFVRSATDVQRRQQQRKPRRVGGVAGGGGGEQWPAEDSLTKETAQYEEEKKAYRQRIQPNKCFKKYPPQI